MDGAEVENEGNDEEEAVGEVVVQLVVEGGEEEPGVGLEDDGVREG